MKNYVRYDSSGKIEKSGQCSTAKFKRLKEGGIRIIEGVGNDVEHKVVNGKIVFMGEAVKPPPVEYFRAIITKKQWESVLERLEKLEGV